MGGKIPFEGLHNARDLGGMAVDGGKVVRDKCLIRSDQLYSISDDDRVKLEGMGIGKVFDFRSSLERDEKPDPSLKNAENIHLPIIKDVRTGITRGSKGNARMLDLAMSGNVDEQLVDQHMCNMYRQFITDPFAQRQYARFVDETIETAKRGGAVLWHCTAGKDRAGFATAIMLEALGAQRSDIFEDYLSTNRHLEGTIDGFMVMLADKLPSQLAARALHRFFLANESYLQAAYDEIDERYGSADAFLGQALGIDEAKRQTMRELFLA